MSRPLTAPFARMCWHRQNCVVTWAPLLAFAFFLAVVHPAPLSAQESESIESWLDSTVQWGWDEGTLQSSYPFPGSLITAVPGVQQDLEISVFGHHMILGFFFEDEGLFRIAGSFHFAQLNEQQVLAKSELILASIQNTYGLATVSHAWDGHYFGYFWKLPETIMVFVWNGGDSWGVHFHSRELDQEPVRHYEATVFQ